MPNYEDYMTELVTGAAPPSLREVLSGQGNLNPAEKAYMGGGDFSGVGVGGGAGLVGPVRTTLPANWNPMPAAVAPLVGAVSSAVPALAGVAGLAGAAYGVWQGLGGGEGGGLFGNNLLGGDEFSMGGIQFGGPGLPEPSAKYVLKEWHVNYSWGKLQYYLVQVPGRGRKIAMYNSRTKRWKVWAWHKPLLAVIGKNMPKHKQLVHLRKLLMRHKADAKTILKLTEPTALKTRRRRR